MKKCSNKKITPLPPDYMRGVNDTLIILINGLEEMEFQQMSKADLIKLLKETHVDLMQELKRVK